MNGWNDFRESRFMTLVNVVLTAWCIATLPLQYFLGFRIMSPIMYSCALHLSVCLLQYLFLKVGSYC